VVHLMMDTNFTGAVYCTQYMLLPAPLSLSLSLLSQVRFLFLPNDVKHSAALPHLRASHGQVVAVSSVAGELRCGLEAHAASFACLWLLVADC
jgi:NAD(P)-dependent dehydrogenase (short-subunit alcohol dehydrogenase family)